MQPSTHALLRTALLTAAALVLPGAAATPPAAAQESPPPCSAAPYDHFDFWVGEWDVYRRSNGQLAGHNTIREVMGGCVLHERYSTPDGSYHGESFNTYDAGRGVWHQSWVDNQGLLLRLDGGLRDGAMVLQGEVVGPDGETSLHRISWSILDGDPDRVRQLWESSSDGGQSWSVLFDGEYRRSGG